MKISPQVIHCAIGKSRRPLYRTGLISQCGHCIGIVRSNVVLTFFQVISRLVVLWGVIIGVPAVSINMECTHYV